MKKEYEFKEDNQLVVADNGKNKYGQYFTPYIIAKFMVELANIERKGKVLEPSCGKGVFIDALYEKGFKNITAYEIDSELINKYNIIKYESFVSAKINEKFDLIIGNPPYIRWKNLEPELKNELVINEYWRKYFNSLCDYLYIFILKSIELLKENGQLIFICPEYWMNTTHSVTLRNYMVENGYFEKIYHFNETPIFNGANVSIVIFKYIKSKDKNERTEVVKYFRNKTLTDDTLTLLKDSKINNSDIKRFFIPHFEKNKRWLLSHDDEVKQIKKFEESCGKFEEENLFSNKSISSYYTVGEICHIGNGMVSGLDKAFQINGINMIKREKTKVLKVIKAKNLEPFKHKSITKYIFINDVKTEKELRTLYPNFYMKLHGLKDELEERYNYKKIIHYWQWVFLRNYKLFSENLPRIFVPCKERISNKDYFRFAYVPKGIYPTQDVTGLIPKKDTKESIYYILAFLNNHRVFTWLKNNGIIKGNIVEFSEGPISSIPFRKINWNDEKEIIIHNQIVIYIKNYLKENEDIYIDEVNYLFDKLIEN